MAESANEGLSEPLKLSEAERRLLDAGDYSHTELRLHELLQQYIHADNNAQTPADNLKHAELALEIAGLQLDLDQKSEAWQYARPAVDVFVEQKKFEDAAMAAQYVYLCGGDDAISAIGQAAWLSVTYPVNPHLTANILDHIIDETPDNSDGAAVAAATAHFVADVRCVNNDQEQIKVFTGSMLARVARRHSNVQSQEQFARWVTRLELDDPEKFLVRLRNVVDVMVQDDWWFDRDALSVHLPDA